MEPADAVLGGGVPAAVANAEEFDSLLAPLLRPGFRLACAMLHDAAAAEDAVQEAAFSAWRKRRDLRDPARARAWFLSIVANQCRSARRRRWWSVLRLPETASVPGHAETVSSGVALRRAVSGLGHRNRLVVVLRFYLDLPVEEVAAVTGLSADAVESRLRRAVKELRKVLVDADV